MSSELFRNKFSSERNSSAFILVHACFLPDTFQNISIVIAIHCNCSLLRSVFRRKILNVCDYVYVTASTDDLYLTFVHRITKKCRVDAPGIL